MSHIFRLLSLFFLLSLLDAASPGKRHPRIDDSGLDLRTLESPVAAAAAAEGTTESHTAIKEIYPPVAVPTGVTPCKVSLVKWHVFDASANYLTKYNPPTGCGNTWSKVVLFVDGRVDTYALDRVLDVYLDGLQILRTSTPAGYYATGTKWNYTSDVTKYASYLTKSHSAIIYSPLDANYSGVFNISITLSFYKGKTAAKYADVVLPISPSSATLPDFEISFTKKTGSTKISGIPRNIYRAEIEIITTPRGRDRLTVFTIPKSLSSKIPDIRYDRHVFHDVEVSIDGQFAGIVIPKTVLYPSFFDHQFWLQSTGTGVFNHPTYFLDVTPFVGLINDGKPHNFSFTISTVSEQSTWLTSGILHLWQDEKSTTTKGGLISISRPSRTFSWSWSGNASTLLTVRYGARRSYTTVGYVATSFGNITTTVNGAKGFNHRLRYFLGGVTWEASTLTKSLTQVKSIDKSNGKVWYSKVENLEFPLNVTNEYEYGAEYFSYAQGSNLDLSASFNESSEGSVRQKISQTGVAVRDYYADEATQVLNLAYNSSVDGCYTHLFVQQFLAVVDDVSSSSCS